MTPQEFLAAKAAITNEALRAYVQTWRNVPPTLQDAIVYSLMDGGKRLRPALCLGAAALVGGDETAALPAACALEMIHTYSLIHDDLPCMDDDDLRRGKPTSHRVYGEAMAVLAGDGLLTMAFDLLSTTADPRVIREIAQAAGVAGMVGGQAMDVLAEDAPLVLDDLQRLHAAKTGALIRASARSGAMLGGAGEAELAALTTFGEQVGLAFQIADDILDVVGTESRMGKRPGGDAAHAKSTYPGLVGLEEARGLGEQAVARAIAALEPFGPRAGTFRDLARYVMDRDR